MYSFNTPRFVFLITMLVVVLLVAMIVRHPSTAAPAVAATQTDGPPPVVVPDFSIPIGSVRTPLAYRIVSFHRAGLGPQTKNLIKLAAQLGFNGVQFQIEGRTPVKAVQEFADRDATEHLVEYCHSLGMKVTVWVHEFSELPSYWSADYVGPVSAANDRLFDFLGARYERMLTQTIPNVDGLVLTVVETQVGATDTQVMLRLVDLLSRKCREHGKSLVVRTFVWYPDEFASVMEAIGQLPPETVIMSKVVPQDWQMRGANAREIGAVGGRPQIVEYDACGEYFLKSNAANCMVDLLKRQFDYGLTKNVQGICVRVDRDDSSVLFGPNEVNLWALGLMAAGATDNAEDIWHSWATYRYGPRAAGAVVAALKPTSEVVAEMLSVGPFTFGDTRTFPPLPDDEDIFLRNWQNWRWDASYAGAYAQADRGDAAFRARVAAQKQAAMGLAEECLVKLEAAKRVLPAVEYEILRTKLLTNKTQLAVRGPMVMAALEFHAMINARTEEQERAMARAIAENIAKVRAVAATLDGEGREIEYLGRRWEVGAVQGLSREQLEDWADDADLVLTGEHVPRSTMRLRVR